MELNRSGRAYRSLLVLLPPGFRRRHGSEMAASFNELLREAHAAGGRRGVATAWVAGSADLLWYTLKLRLTRLRRVAGRPRTGLHAPARFARPDEPGRRNSASGRHHAGGGKPRHGGSAPGVRVPLGSGDLGRDLKAAARALRRAPGFSAIAAATLALGIGLNVAVFSVVDGILLRALPYPQAERIVQLWGTVEGELTGWGMASLPDLEDWVATTTAFTSLAGYSEDRSPLSGGDEPALVDVGRVTAGFFEVLGIEATRGRVLQQEDFRDDATAAAVISQRAWHDLFAGDPGVLGRVVRLGDGGYTIIGVLPARDHALPSLATDFWIPQEPGMHRGSRSLNAIGRLADGVSLQQAQLEIDGTSAALAAAYPDSNAHRSARLVPLKEIVVGNGGRLLLVLFGATGFILVIAATNIVNLLHTRTLDRGRELAIRTALGASRIRLLSHLGAEALLLAAGGGLLGVGVAYGAVEVFVALAPAEIPRLEEVAVGGGTLAFATLVTLAMGVLAGIVPAFRAPAAHRASPRASQPRRDRRGWLIATEVALSVVLVVGASLLLRSFSRLQGVDTGFDATGVLSLRLDLPASRYPGPAEVMGFHERLLDRIAALPEVSAVGGVTVLPFARGSLSSSIVLDGVEREDLQVEFRSVSHDYFGALGMVLRAGRSVGANDTRTTPPVTVVNRALAQAAWGEEDPIGRTLTIFDRAWTVVGVVNDVRHFGLATAPAPEMYVAYGQQPRRYLTHVIRTAGDPAALIPTLRSLVRAADPELPIADVATMEERVWQSAAAPRFRTGVLGALALTALTLAMVGVYGVASFAVSRRTREIGIRRALGARTAGVIGLVVGRGMVFVAIGIASGTVLAGVLAGSLRSLLFEVEPLDPPTFVTAVAVVGAAALLGCVFPALRAAAVDPVTAIGNVTDSR